MKAEYDRDADAAYFQFSPSDSARQVRLDDSRIVDYASDGSLVGVEILSPSRGVDLSGIPRAVEIAGVLRRLGFRVTGLGRAAGSVVGR